MPDPAVSELIDARLRELHERHLPLSEGAVRGYYTPGDGYREPTPSDPEAWTFGVALCSIDGEIHTAGAATRPFALQSLSKVVAYALALEDLGPERVLERVGVEPSGDSFASIAFDERRHRPYNPMVNAGALVTIDLVRGAEPEEKLERIVDLMRRLAANPDLAEDQDTLAGERRTADRNRATAYLMRSQGMLDGDVEAILDLYLRQCSVHVSCRDLSVIGATLAHGCTNPVSGEQVLPRERVRDLLTVMYTCGMYDYAGQWAFEVGVPAKSGVSGGILAAVPDKLGIGVFSPGLDEHGNSVRGVRVCQEVAGRLGLHVFAAAEEDVLLRAP